MENKTSLVFTGDIGFDRYMDGKWEDEELLSLDILEYLHSADHVIANIEGALVEQKMSNSSSGVAQLLHTMNPNAIKVFRKMHADIWNLANNHIMDAGEMGVQNTLNEAKKFGAKTIGAGMNIQEAKKPIIIDEAGGIGIFGVGYQRGCKPASENKAGCLSWSDMELIQENIDMIKKSNRWCVVVSHGGEEFTALPSPYTRKRYLQYLKMGADIIVGHHPHVPMNYEIIEKKAIFYSLGNFIFDTDYQRAQYNTDIGLLLKLSFTKNDFAFEPFGIKILRDMERIEKEISRRYFEMFRKRNTICWLLLQPKCLLWQQEAANISQS